MATVGDLHNLIVSKLPGAVSKRCLTSAAFYRTRQGIVDALGIDRRRIRPDTPLDAILRRRCRREDWRRIQRAARVTVPNLELPAWTQLGLLALGIAVTTITAFRAGVEYWAIFLLIFLGFLVGCLLIRLSRPLAVAFPNRNVTVGDLARDVLAMNYARLVDESGGWNKSGVWETLRRLIVIQTGAAPREVRPETHFVYDLGFD